MIVEKCRVRRSQKCGVFTQPKLFGKFGKLKSMNRCLPGFKVAVHSFDIKMKKVFFFIFSERGTLNCFQDLKIAQIMSRSNSDQHVKFQRKRFCVQSQGNSNFVSKTRLGSAILRSLDVKTMTCHFKATRTHAA